MVIDPYEFMWPRPGSVRHIQGQCDPIDCLSGPFLEAMLDAFWQQPNIGDTRLETRDFDLCYFNL